MAITRLKQSGLEVGNLTEFTGYSGIQPSVSTGNIKTGTYKLEPNYGGASQAYWSIPATRQIRTGFFWNPNSTNSQNERALFQIKNVSGTVLLSIQFTGAGYGNNLIIDVSGTNQDVEANASSGSNYLHLGIDLKVDASAGWVKVYKDGVEILSFSGNTGNTDIADVLYGNDNNIGAGPVYYDDIYLDDTTGESAAAVCPIKRFQYLNPNGNGFYNGNWEGSDGNNTDNYLLVDEVPPNGDTDYVQETVADSIDSYAMATYSLASNETCVAVIPQVYCKRTGTTEQIAIGTRSSSDAIGSDQNPATSYTPLWERQTTKPAGGAWDQSAIDALEVLIKSRGTY